MLLNTEKIEKDLTGIEPNYRPISDGAPSALFRFGKPDIELLLLNLFTACTPTVVSPIQWKVPTIILYEIGPLYYARNYRPKTYTPILARLLTTNDIHGESYDGFPKRSSCTSCHFDFSSDHSKCQ